MSRQSVAKELCEKDGKVWNELDDPQKHSYFHYADVVIRNESRPVKEGTAKVKLGHSHEEAETPQVLQGGETGTFENLTEAEEPEPEPTPVPDLSTMETYEEAEAVGAQMIARTMPPDDVSTKPIPIPKPGFYQCTRCQKQHRETSKIGKRHLEYKG